MDRLKTLIQRYWPTASLFLFGFFLILYTAMGILYFRQNSRQDELQERISGIMGVVSRPLPSVEKLQAEYDAVNQALVPFAAEEVLDIIVKIAEESGVDVDPASGEFTIPALTPAQTKKMGEGNYQVLAISNIRAQGDYDNVMAFVTKIDSNEILKTMALKSAHISQFAFAGTSEEKARQEEFYTIFLAVRDLMADNDLSEIPYPMDFVDGLATNKMGDDPDTRNKIEGFPDIISTIDQKGYTGEESPRNGYVLFEHDEIVDTDMDNFTTVSYVDELETEYYYTCEADGTLRQFDGPDVTTATEYPISEREARRRELYLVSQAVSRMMQDNNLMTVIPSPLNFISGVATNSMGDNPNTKVAKEGFPDIITTTENKGYTGDKFPRNGYVLYEHDKTVSTNTTLFETISYFPYLSTEYYYTCERNGTVRQFDGPDVLSATEYLNVDTLAILSVEIYTKPQESE
ncbi:MAG TPA: hypothetical protein VMW00_01960 [Dehalococcoidales bacterium]|nr:hypothetical protein [Dehalococcoidales bacterium]